jgi:SAM-dependent methyltransferase
VVQALKGVYMAELAQKSSLLIPERQDAIELLDEGAGSLEELRASLDEVWRINRFFGNLGSLTRFLEAGMQEQHLSIADLGTGSGKMALYLKRWAQRKKFQLDLYPVDFSERVLSIARANTKESPDIHLVQADGVKLPFAPQSIDYYLSTLLMHHFNESALTELLGEAYERARIGIVMSDLVRGVLPIAAYHLIRPVFARQYYTWHDGLVSLRRAYIPEELKAIAQAAGIKRATIYHQFPWRMVLVAYKQHV